MGLIHSFITRGLQKGIILMCSNSKKMIHNGAIRGGIFALKKNRKKESKLRIVYIFHENLQGFIHMTRKKEINRCLRIIMT